MQKQIEKYPMDDRHVWAWEVKSSVAEFRKPKDTAKFYDISLKEVQQLLSGKIKKAELGKNSCCYDEDHK